MQLDLEKMEREMRIRNLSPKTRASYLSAVRRLLACCGGSVRSPEEDVKNFLLNMERAGVSPQTRNLALHAIQFFYQNIATPKRRLNIRPAKKRQFLPVVLTHEEVERILAVARNPKHRLLLALAYSAGLRVSEAVSLCVRDLDLDSLTIHIKESKGRKDRITLVSEKLSRN